MMDSFEVPQIHCNVGNCVHNRQGCECVAGRINILNQCTDPHACEETECRTFQERRG